MTNTERLKAPRIAAQNVGPDHAAVTATRPVAASDQDVWAGVKPLLEIGFAVVRVIELAILFG